MVSFFFGYTNAKNKKKGMSSMLTEEQAVKVQRFLLTNYDEESNIEELLQAKSIGLAYTTSESGNRDIQVTLFPETKELITTIRHHQEQLAYEKIECMSATDWEYFLHWDFTELVGPLFDDYVDDEAFLLIEYIHD